MIPSTPRTFPGCPPLEDPGSDLEGRVPVVVDRDQADVFVRGAGQRAQAIRMLRVVGLQADQPLTVQGDGPIAAPSKGRPLLPIPEELCTNPAFGRPGRRTPFDTAGKSIYRVSLAVVGHALGPPIEREGPDKGAGPMGSLVSPPPDGDEDRC
jgi:hypothetical protein